MSDQTGMTHRGPQPLEDVAPHEVAYLRLVRRYGRPAPLARRLDIQAASPASGAAGASGDLEGDCWTYAWQLAQRDRGSVYVEGVCRRRGAGGPSFHAWVEQAGPLGRVLIECTPGYEDASGYVGIPVCTTAPLVHELTGEWKVRYSVLQYLLAGGLAPRRVLKEVGA